MLRKSGDGAENQNAEAEGSDSDGDLLEFLENLDEEQATELMNLVGLLQNNGFFARPGFMAAGEVNRSHFNENEKALHDLVGEISGMTKNPDFTERARGHARKDDLADLIEQAARGIKHQPQ